MQTWTLDMMRRFVLTHEAKIPCPSCKGSRSAGIITFRPRIIIAPAWNDETMDEEAKVTLEAQYTGQSCFCGSRTQEEYTWVGDQAYTELSQDFAEFLRSQPSADPVEDPQRLYDLALKKSGYRGE